MARLLAFFALLAGLIALPQAPAEAARVCFSSHGRYVCVGKRPYYYYRAPRYGYYAPGYYYRPYADPPWVGPPYYGPGDYNFGCPRGYTRQSGVCKPYRGY